MANVKATLLFIISMISNFLVIFSFFIFFSPLPCFTASETTNINNYSVMNFTRLQLISAEGPESFAFDCKGEGPYTGVSDGRILKWQDAKQSWVEFAVTSNNRRRDLCDGSMDPRMERICGRPLGLQFNKQTCDLYIADAYFGLLKVSSNGGVATQIASTAENTPFKFTNALDIDQHTGAVYFTDSSIFFRRWAIMLAILFGDNTGRLMKYDPQSQEVTVLLRGLKVANGVALSRNNSYILVAETTRKQILRYWLEGPKARTSEVFAHLPNFPDNIKRNARGEFWVALNNGRGRAFHYNNKQELILIHQQQQQPDKSDDMEDAVALRLDEEGEVLEVLGGEDGRVLESISEVEENKGSLWIGSVVLPYVSLAYP